MLLLALLACRSADPPTQVCPPPAVEPGEVRVRQLACEADLPTGAFAAARVGDWVLENRTSRWVVRDGAEGHALVGLTGGNLVDAVRMEAGEQLGEDGLREYATALGFHVLAPTAFTPGEGSLEVRGTLEPFRLVTDILQLPRPSAEVSWEYVLAPDDPVLEVRAHIAGGESSLADIVLVRGGHQLFVPGEDPWDLPLTTDAADLGVWSSDPALGPALATQSDTQRNLLYAGPIRVVLYQPVEGTVTKRIALGEDHAAAAAWLDPDREIWANAQGLVEIRDASGAPVTRCRGEACAVPPEAVEAVPVWLGDGNGGPGGPGQDGVPARLRVTAPAAYRATAVRSDGMERFLLDPDGDGTFLVPPGDWQVTVTAGPTYTLHEASVALVAGEEAVLDAPIREVVDTTGWSAADLHVHMETSLDSDITTAHRMRGVQAEHLDYVVTTDHDFVGSPEIPEGLVLRASAEVSTMLAGHFNAWPVVPDADRAGSGAPDWRGLGPEALVDTLPGLVQCNHPRFVDGGYAASFDVGLAPERCDLVEVLNGFSPAETPAVVVDLLDAWSRGHRPVATGASDSHAEDDFVGNPRTWIHAEGDADALDAALGAGRAVASGGPFVTLSVSSGSSTAGVGETLVLAGPAMATLHLQAPDWMPLGELVLVVDGEEVWAEDLSGLPAVDGLEERVVDVPVAPSTFVMALHRGALARFPATHAPPDVVTNPVYVAPR
ncbi:MAG: CehA/McbA family metallohydrolase [Alphaproteobacteria bacterium]|nr:CehA/McbA family metallohydrolase [Alphaproteobacteria bacterium]